MIEQDILAILKAIQEQLTRMEARQTSMEARQTSIKEEITETAAPVQGSFGSREETKPV